MTTHHLPAEQVPALTIPVLTSAVPMADVPPGTLAALENLRVDKAAFFAMADELKQSLRPELERLVDESVQRSLRAAWAKKSAR